LQGAEWHRNKKHRVGTGSINSLSLEKMHQYLNPFKKQEKIKFSIEEVKIFPIKKPDTEQKALLKEFKSCFGNNETIHHGYLKWFALNFLKQIIREQIQIDFTVEANSYIPNRKHWACSSYDSSGRILRKREATVFSGIYAPRNLPESWTQEIDVAAIVRPPIIECGATSTMSLSLPLTTGMASAVYWLPFTTPERKNTAIKSGKILKHVLKLLGFVYLS
jgi:hypothetical protein